MKDKQDVKRLLDYFQTLEEKQVQFDEQAIVADYQKGDNNSSIAIKVLSIFGSILASCAFLGFLFVAGLYDSYSSLLIFGGCCIVGAIWLNKAFDKLIIDTLSVCWYIIGFLLLGYGLMSHDIHETTISILFIIIAFTGLCIAQNYILSFISILIINGSILTLILLTNDYNLIHIYICALAIIITYLFLKEAKIITMNAALSKLYNPIRIGLIFSFLSVLLLPDIDLYLIRMVPWSRNYILLSSVVIISSIIFLISNLFKILDISKIQFKVFICVFSVLILLPTALSPNISGAILIILLSFLVNYKTGLVIGIIAFIYFISQYYYNLNFTLLYKSIILFSTGILFIALYLFTHKKLTSDEKL